nr:hypothetical protein [Planctomycetales bacterium]NIM09733.1 hypothetical protein [Planctomycetales bacterium]NIN09208.1 hypothetical protein [Planctomycetales bacterium]NIN78305.1 hypothetical protein [Planctomycetales bacterium]NIO35484.1 hypothetical protein [Planctomycetales bacterium]
MTTRPGRACCGWSPALALWRPLVMLAFGTAQLGAAQPLLPPNHVLAGRPQADDFTIESLRRYTAWLEARYGDDYRNVPLAVKADFFEWLLWRYHLTAYGQIANRVALPGQQGPRPAPQIGSDTSTWNGALLAGLCYQYAVTRNEQTLQRIRTLLDGLRFYTTVTGRLGCYARCVVPQDTPLRDHEAKKFGLYRYRSPAGETFFLLASPAKGTYNQLAFGYAALLRFAYDDLPPADQSRVRSDVTQLVTQLLRDDYHITDVNGHRTPHGDLTPIVASVGVPFNGQVAYHLVALGRYFPRDDPVADQLIQRQFHRLREKR